MDFIFDNIKILIFVGAAVLWVVGKIAEAKKKQQEQQQGQPWSPADDDGYDYDEAPQSAPPPYRPMVPPPLPRAAVAPPDFPSEDRELARQRAMQERLSALRKERTAVSKASKKPVKAKAAPMVSPSSLKARLRDRRELRRAIVMREILDPPVGLR